MSSPAYDQPGGTSPNESIPSSASSGAELAAYQQPAAQSGYDQGGYEQAYAQPGYDQGAYQQAYAQPGYAQGAYQQAYAQPGYAQGAYQQAYAQPGYAQGAYQQPYAQPAYVGKSKVAAGLLGIFLGSLGIHNFYLGYTGKAVAQLLISLLSLGMLAWAVWIWGLVEGILILTAAPGAHPWGVDARGVPLRD